MRGKFAAFSVLFATTALFRPLSAAPPVRVDSTLRQPPFQPTGQFIQIAGADFGVYSRANRNLFFSFERFNVPAGGSVTFTSGIPVRNIVARVTGNQRSRIQGLLRVDVPDANFFLLNPNGIAVSQGAQFQVDGSVTLTTADEVRFKKATFSAQAPSSAILSGADPVEFGFLKRRPAAISVAGVVPDSGNSPPAGKSLSLVAGGIDIASSLLRQPAGRIDLVSLSSPGEVTITPGRRSELSVNAAQRGSITVTDRSKLELIDGGSLRIWAGNLTLDSATIDARAQDTPGKKRVRIDLSGDMVLCNSSLIDAGTLGAQTGARIDIRSSSVRMTGASIIQANIGTPNDDAEDPIKSALNTQATGNGGSLRLHTARLSIEDRSLLSSYAFGPGAGGTIRVVATDQAVLKGPALPPGLREKDAALLTGIIAKTDDQAAAGPAGTAVALLAGELQILRGAAITSTTKTARGAGNVLLAADRIIIDGTGRDILTGVEARAGDAPAARGSGGSITVRGSASRRSPAKSLLLRNNGVLSASTFGVGKGGNVVVNAKEINIDGPQNPTGFTGLFARSPASAPVAGNSGDGGNVTVFSDSMRIGAGGSISADSHGLGNAGDIEIHARYLTLDGGTILAATLRAQTAGDIRITDAESVILRNRATLTTQARNDGGDIRIDARDKVIVSHSLLTAQATTGKRLTIDPTFVVLNSATINGLDLNNQLVVTIVAENFLKTFDSLILTSTQANLPPDIDLSAKVLSLDAGALQRTLRLSEQCGLRIGGDVSSFLISGKGAAEPSPGGLSPSSDHQPLHGGIR